MFGVITFLPYNLSVRLQKYRRSASASFVLLSSHSSRGILSDPEREGLKELYSRLYSVQSSLIEITSSYMKYKEVTFNGKLIGSHKSRSNNSSLVMCVWEPLLSSTYNVLTTHSQPVAHAQEERPARINFLAKHTIHIHHESFTHVLFSASWFKRHPKRLSFGSPISVWECDIFDLSFISSLIPIQFIKSRTVSLVDSLDDTSGHVLFVVPCIDF